MRLWKNSGAVPFFLASFCTAFVQMGLFIVFQRWLSFSFVGPSFFWRSMLLQFAIFIPCIFMMPASSYFTSRFRKGRVMAWSSVGMAASLIPIAVLFGLDIGWVAFGLVLLFGIFYAIFTPAKLAVIKEIFGEENLAAANAWQMVFSVLGIAGVSCLTVGALPEVSPETAFVQEINLPGTVFNFSVLPYLFLGVGVLSAVSCFFIRGGAHHSRSRFRSPKRIFSATWSIPLIRLSILGLSIFWAISQLFLMLSQDLTGEHLVSLFQGSLILTAVGYIVGAFAAARASHNFYETGMIPFAVVAAAIISFVLPFVQNKIVVSVLYAALGFVAGSLFVLLRTIIQHYAKPNTSGRIHSVSSMIQMSVMFVFLGAQCLLLAFTDLDLPQLFPIVGAILTICFWLTLRKTPMALLRAGLRFAFAFVFRYRVNVMGVQNIPETGPVLLVGPHFSYIDWAVLQIASPRPLRIASNRNTFADWYQRWLFHRKFLIPINRRDPKPAMEEINKALKNGEVVVIFPEGEVSKSPFISKFSLNYHDAVVDTDAQVVPFYIQGLWGSRYSHASECVNRPQTFNRTVSVGFSKPVPHETSEEQIRDHIQMLSTDVWNLAMDHSKTIVPLWFRAMMKRRNRPILIDPAGRHVSGYTMIRLCHQFGDRIKAVSRGEKRLGFMLPTSRDAALGIMSILGTGKTTVNLNYTAPVDTVLGCIAKAEISTVVTTRAFFDKLCGKNAAFAEVGKVCKMIYLDEEESKLGMVSRLYDNFVIKVLPRALVKFCWFTSARLEDDAIILFSSGSEGTPKGVELTHKNIVSNSQQCDYIVKLHRGDVMTALLPLFHSFGFTMTFMMALLDGVPMVLCPDPTDIKTLARVCAQYKTTILMGTPTFLRAIAINRWVHPMCLDSIRMIVAGAEKLRPEMRDAFKLKFGKDIYEAYGCTELSPLATLNAPNVLLDDFLTMCKCSDTTSIGQIIPGSYGAIIDPETNEFLDSTSEGMLAVTGPQVLRGYLKDPEKTSQVVFEKDGRRWYKTGDKCTITADGFVQILGRYSRFAKLGGEMISLTAVELRLAETGLLEGMEFAVVAVPDSVKGERIVLLVVGDFDPEDLSRKIRKSGIPPLMIPGSVFRVESIPKLGSGKWDFTNMKKLAIELVEKAGVK